MNARHWSAVFFLIGSLAVGCQEAEPPANEEPATPPAEMGARFDAASAGTIRGQVLWAGAVPAVPRYRVPGLQFGITGPQDRLIWDNPNVPHPAANGGVGDVIVFLRQVDPVKARPWDHASVQIEMRDFQLQLWQGEALSRVGFVRRGDGVTMVSRQAAFHSLHGDGADFFTTAFADPNQTACRRLKTPGIVELQSAANYFWMRGYLFVVEHPYYARTDAAGKFELPGVPPGRYEVVCWVPNWVEDHHHRDPESVVITRLYFRPPVERAKMVTVERNASADVSFTLTRADFER